MIPPRLPVWQNELMGCGACVRMCMCVVCVAARGGREENTGAQTAGTGNWSPAGPSPQPTPCMARLPPAGWQGKGPACSLASWSSIQFIILIQHSGPAPSSASWCSTRTPSGQCPSQHFSWDRCQIDVEVILHGETHSVYVILSSAKHVPVLETEKLQFLTYCKF